MCQNAKSLVNKRCQPYPAAKSRQEGRFPLTSDRLLTEKQRQQKYLDLLPENFDFPLFNARRALESQRASGYRTSAAASREIVDNSIEAGADEIHIVFENALYDGKKTVTAVAFIDNGPGMLANMARYALSWGGGTHYDDPAFIGKFGFGLPNASINQTRKTEVYTRMNGDEPFTKATLDIDTFAEFGAQSIPKPEQDDLPAFVQNYINFNGLDLNHGTVVIWVNPDRLSFKKTATLREHLLDDFGVVYRNLLVRPEGAVNLIVDGAAVKPVDPLFLMPTGRYYKSPEDGGAQLIEERFIPVKYYKDEIGERHLVKIENLSELDPEDKNILASGTLHIRISRLPVGFAVFKKSNREDKKDDSNRRFDIRKPRRGMSFVRAGREIETVDLFPKTDKEEAKRLGDWPTLQTYAYHWGVETNFPSDLDMVMGVTNDKQGVRPIEDFWRVLNETGVAADLRRENEWQRDERERKIPTPPIPDAPSAAEQSAKDADSASGTDSPNVPEEQKPAAVKGLEEEATKRAAVSDKTIDEVRKALETEARRRPYRIEYYSSEDGPFYKPMWVGGQIVIYVNQSHPFYQVLYGDLLRLRGGARAKQAVDLLLITLGRAELTSDEEMRLWYETQRKKRWSPFLETSMSSLRQRLETPEDLVDNNEEDVVTTVPDLFTTSDATV